MCSRLVTLAWAGSMSLLLSGCCTAFDCNCPWTAEDCDDASPLPPLGGELVDVNWPLPHAGCGSAPAGPSKLVAIWANEGGDKVARHERRAWGNPAAVRNAAWNGQQVTLLAARNEVVSINLVLEAGGQDVPGVSVALDRLESDAGHSIGSLLPATADGVFDWTQRPIELFHVRYLQIRGLSLVSYDLYDERHLPERFRRPWSGEGEGIGGWADRPDHDAYYPEIAVPLELVGRFDVRAGRSQCIWIDVYVPPETPAGVYRGTIAVCEDGVATRQVPVELRVRGFTLPDTDAAKTMVYFGYDDVLSRYVGELESEAHAARLRRVRDRHFQLARRHRVHLVDDNLGSTPWSQDAPHPDWLPRLSGALYTAARGYAGPGAGRGNDVFAIGPYGTWSWRGAGQAEMWARTNAWESWFRANAPAVERLLYLFDEPEPADYSQVQQWAAWMDANPGVGSALPAFVTLSVVDALAHTPNVDIAASWRTLGSAVTWESAIAAVRAAGKRVYLYNAYRPHTGTFATEDDGTALRQLAWALYKHGIDRWFYWESTYYTNFLSGEGPVNVFQRAQTFGENERYDPSDGRTGYQYANGDGVLFYPGTDRAFPDESFNVAGPFASLRLKHWRRGLQDVEYLKLAAAIAPQTVQALVAKMSPVSLWEHGVTDPADPTYVLAATSWPTAADAWEQARVELATIIDGQP